MPIWHASLRRDFDMPPEWRIMSDAFILNRGRLNHMDSLQFNVSQLLREPSGATRSYELDDDISDLTDQVQVTAPLRGTVQFTRTSDGILVEGDLETSVQVLCSRCAIDFVQPVRIEMEEEFRPTYDVVTGLRIVYDESIELDDATMIDERHMLDLSEVMRQNLIVSVPPFPTCKPDCAGLCPHCGQDLNEGTCNCLADSTDSRWSVLQDLLDQRTNPA